MGYIDDLRDEYKKLTSQPTQTTVKADNKTIEALRNEYRALTQPVQQPVTQPKQTTTTQTTQPVVTTTPIVKSHAGVAQANDKARTVSTPVTDKLKSGKSLTPEETIEYAREQGIISSEDAEYEKKKLQANQIPQVGKYASEENKEKDKVVHTVEKEQGKKDAAKTKVTVDNAAKEFVEATESLAKAKANNDYREIAKNEEIIKKAKEEYQPNEDYKDIDIASVRNHLNGLYSDLVNTQAKYNQATNESEKNRYADEYNATLKELQRMQNTYNEALAYDEIVNDNMLRDIGRSTGLGFLGGVGKIEQGVYATGTKALGLDATTLSADGLLAYNSQGTGTKAASKEELMNALRNTKPTAALQDQPQTAYNHLGVLAAAFPDNIGLQRLYSDITNHTYKGTKEELQAELDRIQKELYQGFKDISGTYNILTQEKQQLQHNQDVYGDLAAIPNAFNTTANMIPSQMLAPIGGEALSLTAMGIGAGGQAMDEALENGATYNQAFNYGVLSGVTEAATEKMFESPLNKFVGIKGSIDPADLSKQLIDALGIKNTLGKLAISTLGNVAGESIEEMASEAVNPVWRYLTYDKQALENFDAGDILRAGLEAVPSTLLMQGIGMGGNAIKTQQIENGIIKSINESDLSQIVKNQLINEVRKASTDIKLGLEEADYMENKMWEKNANLTAQSEQMKQRIPEGYSLPQSTIDILAYTENNRPGLNIAFDTNIQGNGTFVENPDGTRTITLNPNSKRAVEFTLTHELGHDLKGTQEYEQLQDLLLNYAKGKPGYQESLKQLDKTYKESGANFNLEDEATNDMLGQAIGEQEFYNKLAENPTLFNRVTNGLKNLLGNKETKLKNKIEKLTNNALKQEYRGKQEGTQQSLSEDDKTLAATHNLTEDKLRGVLELGGFPVPSIAISKPDVYTGENFGDTTVFFNKETINPSNKENEVYSRDVYSPRFPKVEYKVNSDVRKAIQEEVMNVAGGVDGLVKNPYLHEVHLDMYAQNLDDRINSFGGQEGYIKALSEKHRTPYKYLFLKETNPNFTDVLDENGKIDVDRTNKKIDDIIDQKEYENWLKEKFANIIEKKGIRNNKDYYTNTGTPRSFEALHEEYTLDNVVKIMKALNTTGHESFFMKGFNEVAGTAARKFDSIQDIKNSQDLLQHVSEENYEELLEPISNRLRDIETDIIEKRDEQGLVSNYFIAMDDLGDAIQKVARKSNQKAKLTPQKVVDIMKKEYYDIDTDIAQRIIDVIYDMKNLPTTYFEAKPQRAVGFEEIASILIPNDLAEETKQQLRDRGIKYIEYDRNIEGDREAKYRQAAQDVLFSKQNGTWQDFLDKNLNLAKGTKTKFEGLPSNEELIQNETKTVENEPILGKTLEKTVENEPITLVKSDDDTLFSLTDEQQQEVDDYANELENDNTIDQEFKKKVLQEFDKIKDYVDFEQIKDKVEQYKEKAYGIEPKQTKVEPKYSDEINSRIQRVQDYITDLKTAESTKGQTLKNKDVKAIVDKYIEKEPGNAKAIRESVKQMNEDMIQGKLTDSKIDEYVEELGDNLKATVTDYYDYYKDLKKQIRDAKIYVSDAVKRGITDYNDFRRRNMGTLTLTSDKSRMGVDQVYQELQSMYPEMLPEDIVNPADQLEYLAELSNGIAKEEGRASMMLDKKYGTGAWEDISSNLKKELKELRDKQGVEYAEVEDKTPKDQKRSWTETSKENELVNEFLDVKDLTYVPESNAKQLKNANNQINKLGYDEAIKYIDNKVNLNERFTANDIALGETLIQEAIKKGDFEKAQDLISDVAIIGTELGQAVQALSIIQRMTPEGQLKHLNKVVNKINERIDSKNQNSSKQLENIKIDPELAENILKATNEQELQEAMDAALQKIADQMPVSMSDKIAEWRYLAMLANPRTHVRNMLANVAMRGTYESKNIIQRTIETLASPLLDERTRTFKKASKDVKKFAEQSMKDNANRLAGTKERGIESRLKEMQKVFKNVPLEKLRRLNSNLLSMEDNIFTNNAFKLNLQEYLTANGIKTQHDIDMNPELVQKGINYAVDEAFKTTFHQMSKIASLINKAENSSAVAKVLVGGTIPFKKTPINIAKTGASYSPLGLLETLTAETYKLKKGDITANQWIDRLSQGLTGTALFGVGALLANMGILKASTDDEEYEESIGQTGEYSVRLGDKNYDISWLAPSGIPLLMGAELVNANKGGEGNLEAMLQSLEKSLNPLNDMSVLQGVSSTLASYSNKGIGGKIGAMIENAAKSYFGQFLPTIGGQVNKIIDDTQRTTTASKNSKWRAGESFARQQLNKIPGASFLLEPKTDVWGNDVKRDSNPAVRAFDALINPGNVTQDKTTPVDEELLSLFSEVGDKDVKPKIPSAYFNKNNYKYEMSAKEYTKYKKDYGQKAYDDIAALIDGAEYKEADNEEKAKMIKDIYTEAQAYAREEYGINPTDLTEKYGEREAAQRLLDKELYEKWWKVGDVGLDNFWNAYNAQKAAQPDKYSNGKTIPLSKDRNRKTAIDKAVNQDELNERQMRSLYEVFKLSNKVY